MNNRWAHIRPDCWQENNPDQYVPDYTPHSEWFDTCEQCGNLAYCLHVHPNQINKPEVQQKGD